MTRLAALLGPVAVCATFLAPLPGSSGLGIGAAEAASRVYTRKKVNGKWITGRFTDGKASATATARAVRFTEGVGVKGKARYASLPKYAPKVQLQTVTKPPASPAMVAPAAPVVPAALPADRVMATASIAPAAAPPASAERLRAGLEARARSLAAELGALPIPSPEPVPPIQLAARSVTFDLQKGERTIVFDDGKTVTAPFDERKASDLTGLRPAR
jgi:hypothetical protein